MSSDAAGKDTSAGAAGSPPSRRRQLTPDLVSLQGRKFEAVSFEWIGLRTRAGVAGLAELVDRARRLVFLIPEHVDGHVALLCAVFAGSIGADVLEHLADGNLLDLGPESCSEAERPRRKVSSAGGHHPEDGA